MKTGHNDYKEGRECSECKAIWEGSNYVCPSCGSMKTHKRVAVRTEWTEAPLFVKIISLNVFESWGHNLVKA